MILFYSFVQKMENIAVSGRPRVPFGGAKYVADLWRMDYNRYRPYSSLENMTPAGFAELYRQASCVRPLTLIWD